MCPLVCERDGGCKVLLEIMNELQGPVLLDFVGDLVLEAWDSSRWPHLSTVDLGLAEGENRSVDQSTVAGLSFVV